jgi:predicted nucleic acid-binding protein
MEPIGRTYFDSNIFIYAFESSSAISAAIARLLERLQTENLTPVTSEYSLAECLAGARKNRTFELEEHYLDYFADKTSVEVYAVTRDILIAAARVAGDSTTKLADAIHIATATAAKCHSFATNDERLRLPPSLRRIRLTPPAGS